MLAELYPLQVRPMTFSGLVNRHQADVVAYLIEENRVLEEQMKGRRLRLTDDQRRRLAAKAKLRGRRALSHVATIVTPDTLMKWQYVQVRLVCSVGASPTWVRVRGPLAWIALVKETKLMKSIDKAVHRHVPAPVLFRRDVAGSAQNFALQRDQAPDCRMEGQQLVEAFSGDWWLPRFLQRDRDGIFWWDFRRKVKAMGIEEPISAPRSPWRNSFVERVIRSIRRECTDHIIPMGERRLLRILCDYQISYNESRTHYSLEGNAPIARRVERTGQVIATPVLGRLHHRYSRAA